MAGKLNTLNLEMTAALSVDRKDFGSDNDEELTGIDLNYGKSC